MNCPKCSCNIDEEMLICPNCKKVLKIVCPKCNTINKTNSCKKCGFVIISKCYKCGRINQTINETCSGCGFSTYSSIAINSSNIDEFACLTIEFSKLDEIMEALESIKLKDKFKANLDQLILKHSQSVGVTREIIENVYIIRFNKDASFKESANNAIKAAIEIQNLITELNIKLNKLKNMMLRCNIAVLKRDIYSKPNQYRSGVSINLIYQNKDNLKFLNYLQVITDLSIYEQVRDNYDLSSLTTNFIKDEMIMFFELNLKKYIKMPDINQEEELADLAKLNIFNDEIETEKNNEIYDVEAINFTELKCIFTKLKSANLIPEILEAFKKNPKQITLIKSEKELAPDTEEILTEIEKLNLFENVLRVTCHENMKYKPYGFFSELISSLYHFTQSPQNIKNNNFEIFKGIDPSGFLKDLINLTERTFPHPEIIRNSLFNIFFNIFNAIPKSLIYIEDFENIDDTSLKILQLFFEKFDTLDVSYLIVASKEFLPHKNSHFLLSNPNYTEINVKPSSFKELIKKNMKKYNNILDSDYLQKIAQNTKGSILYLNHSINYLLERELLIMNKGVLEVNVADDILISTTLDELIIKRLKHLSKDKEAYKMFAMILSMGAMTDLETIKLFGIIDEIKTVKKLIEKKYIYIYRNKIYVPNYNLFKDNFLSVTSLNFKKVLAEELIRKVFSSEIKHPVEPLLYKILAKEKQEFIVWKHLSRLNASLGDFSAYLNCSIKFLKLLNEHINEDSQKTIEEHKMEVYENISNLLYKYAPEKIQNIAQIILERLETSTDDQKVIDFCNKMLQGCLISGNYSFALELTHKILSRFSNSSINLKDKNFDETFFLISLMRIEILFSVGDLKNCVALGDEMLSVINTENIQQLKPKIFSLEQFTETIFDAMNFVAIARVLIFKNDLDVFFNKIKSNWGDFPPAFALISILEDTIKGIKTEIPLIKENDKFSKILIGFISAFNNKDNYEEFASKIYQAKVSAKMNKLPQIELVCDLLIGYSYFKLDQDKKAFSIYSNVLETSTKNGLKIVTNLSWYLISMLKFRQGDNDLAFGIINNAIIQMEKDENACDLLFYLFKMLLSKILLAKNQEEVAELCLNYATLIKEKHNLQW